MAQNDKRKHIMVVNDVPDLLELFKTLLEDAGYRVSLNTFQDPLSTIHRSVKDTKPDLVLLDYVVGGTLAGWQMLQMLKMDPETKGVAVIVCTAATHEVEEMQAQLTKLGVPFVPKPFELDDLFAAIAEKLGTNDKTSGSG